MAPQPLNFFSFLSDYKLFIKMMNFGSMRYGGGSFGMGGMGSARPGLPGQPGQPNTLKNDF